MPLSNKKKKTGLLGETDNSGTRVGNIRKKSMEYLAIPDYKSSRPGLTNSGLQNNVFCTH